MIGSNKVLNKNDSPTTLFSSSLPSSNCFFFKINKYLGENNEEDFDLHRSFVSKNYESEIKSITKYEINEPEEQNENIRINIFLKLYRTGLLMSYVETPNFSVIAPQGIPNSILPSCVRNISNIKIISSPFGEMLFMNDTTLSNLKNKSCENTFLNFTVGNSKDNGDYCNNDQCIKRNCTEMKKDYEEKAKNIFSFSPSLTYDTNGFIRHMSFRDSLNKESVFGGMTNLQVSTSGGRKNVDIHNFMKTLYAFRPHLFTCPADDLTTATETSSKRLNKCINKALHFQNQIIFNLMQPNNSYASDFSCLCIPPYSLKPIASPFLLANIQGGRSKKYRIKTIEKLLTIPMSSSFTSSSSFSSFISPNICGVSYGGFGYGESLFYRGFLLSEMSKILPPKFLRVLPLLSGSPIEIFQGILAGGIDLFELPQPLKFAEKGYAYTFNLNDTSIDATNGKQVNCEKNNLINDDENNELIKEVERLLFSNEIDKLNNVKFINLYDKKYLHDFSKLTEDSIVNESRSYIHHLFCCNEMLGVSLLTEHNLKLYSSLFETIRIKIQNNNFLSFVCWFCKTQLLS